MEAALLGGFKGKRRQYLGTKRALGLLFFVSDFRDSP